MKDQTPEPTATERYIGIGELARESGCKPETVRYYEQIGLLPSAPRMANKRQTADSSSSVAPLIDVYSPCAGFWLFGGGSPGAVTNGGLPHYALRRGRHASEASPSRGRGTTCTTHLGTR